MNRFMGILLCLALMTGVALAAGDNLAGTYDYEFDGMMGREIMRIELSDDDTVQMNLPDNNMITDVYAGTWTAEGDTVSIQTLRNVDTASAYTVPGLWDWIDATTGDATIVINVTDGTFVPGSSGMPNELSDIGDGLSNIIYAEDSSAQTLDLVLPEADGPFPLVVLIHGGGFAMGDKQMPIVQKMFALTDAGYAVATVNYRLSGEATYPAALEDVKTAVAFLMANAEEYGLDAQRVAIWGESAGAYLATMTALTTEDVKVLVDFYGPMTFFDMDADAADLGMEGSTDTDDSFESKFMGQNVGTLDDATKEEISPLTYIDEDTDLTVWIQAGTGDTSVPYLQSVRLADAFIEAIGEERMYFELIEGAAHMDDAFYSEENLDALIEFLKKNL